MKISLLTVSKMFSVAELSSMELNLEVFRFYDAYAPFGFAESPALRAEYLRVVHKKRARARTLTADWVLNGGVIPAVLELVDNR